MIQNSDNTSPTPVTPLVNEPRRITSNELLGGDRCLIIEHGGAEYSLNLTRSKKLILTK